MVEYILAVDVADSDEVKQELRNKRVFLEKTYSDFRWTENIYDSFKFATVDDIHTNVLIKKKDYLDTIGNLVKRHKIFQEVFGNTTDMKDFLIVRLESTDIDVIPESELRIMLGTQEEYNDYHVLADKFENVT